MRRSTLRILLLISVVLSLSPPHTGSAKTGKQKELPRGTPVMWRKPADIASRDLYLGPGGAVMRPDLRRLTFLKQETGGHTTKYRVRDASGREWVAKIGKEAQSETAAVRLLWGIGYETEINYLVPRVTIEGKGTFRNVRFEARPEPVKRLDEWRWKQNPFQGTPAFQGLKVMMALINNWDLKDSNNEILYVDGANGPELRYIISDLGATFGHAAHIPFFWRIMRSRNNPTKYAKTEFLEGVQGDRVSLAYYGKNRGLFHNITIHDAEWLGSWLAQLSDRQIRDAFRAANYTPSQINLLTTTVKGRTKELLSLHPNQRIGRK